MSKILILDDKLTPIHSGAIVDKLEPGNYLLKFDENKGFYLHPKSDFSLPKKIYGNFKEDIERWKKSWENDTSQNLGVLLSGIKGTGKTILCQKFCIEMNLPVIIIGEQYPDASFLDFLSDPCLNPRPALLY